MPEWFGDVVTYLLSLDAATIYAIAFGVLLLCGFGLPIPEDITLVLVGYMTFASMPDGSPRPHANVWVATTVGFLGAMIGDSIMFVLGRRFGHILEKIWPFRSLLADGRRELAEGFLKRNGPKVMFSARFMPGLRSVVFFVSGTMGIRYPQFIVFNGLAALISIPALVISAWYFGEQIELVITKARQAEHGILALIVGVFLIYLLKVWWKNRRERAKEQPVAADSGE